MLESETPEAWQRKKRGLLRLLLAGTLFLVFCATLRFIPSINGALSGEPEYMRWIADSLARKIAANVGGAFPVIALADEQNNCHTLNNARADPVEDLYYVLFYSDATRSVCFLTFAEPNTGSSHDYSLTLTAETGRNYGRSITSPATVVPIGQYVIRFPAWYVSLLHWRVKVDPAAAHGVGAENAQARASLTSSLPKSVLNVTVNFEDLRDAVARRHNTINAVLAALMLVSFLLTALASARICILYREFRRRLSFYHADVAFRPFLQGGLAAISQQAREIHQLEQERMLRATRADVFFRQSKEAIRNQLEALCKGLTDEGQRSRIRQTLDEDDVTKMESLAQQFQSQLAQKTPEEKLTTLLDTLRDYCTSEEADDCRATAFRILTAGGFREARAFVVGAHEQFRMRSREHEKDEIPGAAQ